MVAPTAHVPAPDVDNLCRACFTPLKDMETQESVHIFELPSLLNKLCACISTEFVTPKKGSKYLCLGCSQRVYEFYEFREMCIRSIRLFEKMHYNEEANISNGVIKEEYELNDQAVSTNEDAPIILAEGVYELHKLNNDYPMVDCVSALDVNIKTEPLSDENDMEYTLKNASQNISTSFDEDIASQEPINSMNKSRTSNEIHALHVSVDDLQPDANVNEESISDDFRNTKSSLEKHSSVNSIKSTASERGKITVHDSAKKTKKYYCEFLKYLTHSKNYKAKAADAIGGGAHKSSSSLKVSNLAFLSSRLNASNSNTSPEAAGTGSSDFASVVKPLANFTIKENFKTHPSHKVEVGIFQHMNKLPCKKKENLKQLGVQLIGTMTFSEKSILVENFAKFCQEYDVQDHRPFLSLSHSGLNKADQIKFARYLGQGLPTLTLYAIYRNFKNLFSTKRTEFYPEDGYNLHDILDKTKRYLVCK